MRLAMWSGPRNLSTALMYAFARRRDVSVWDEPFYAAYLALTGADHPMRADILAAHEADPTAVAARCAGPVPAGKPHLYMKLMAHHMVSGMPLGWARDCTNVFLIRHPARVVASYLRKRQAPSLADIGFGAQRRLFEELSGRGAPPLVIDSADIRADPEPALGALCAALGLTFDARMLSWPTGGRSEDGVWAAHWYGAVHRSTGFDAPEGALPEISGAAARLVEAALPDYDRLRAVALRPATRPSAATS